MPIPEAAAQIDCDVKLLRGWVFLGFTDLRYPIGSLDLDVVYPWSLPLIRQRLADRASDGAP